MPIELTSADVPQEDDLAKVLVVLRAFASGLQDTQSISEKCGVSRRHVGYAINAGIALGLLTDSDTGLAMTAACAPLIAQPPGSAGERKHLRATIEASEVVGVLAPGLLDAQEPPRPVLIERIRAAAGLSHSTAERRARTLISWRRQVLGEPPSVPPPAA